MQSSELRRVRRPIRRAVRRQLSAFGGLLAATSAASVVIAASVLMVSGRGRSWPTESWWALGGLVIALGLVGAASGRVLTRRLLRPVRDVTDVIQQVGAGDPSRRVRTVDSANDELTRLAVALDAMLDEVERNVRATRRFVAHASHELRTPLAVTRTVIDVEEMQYPGVNREVLHRIRAMNERSLAALDALLQLSHTGVDDDVRLIPVRLDEVVRSVAEEIRPDAVAQNVRLDVRFVSATVHAEPHLLATAVRNLIRNALQHNVSGGFIVVETQVEPGLARCALANTGSYVDPERVRSLLEPFVRFAGERYQGHGLGLPLVAVICDRFGAQLELRSRPTGGLYVAMEFATDQPTTT
jgi:two-component system, OmpR family, sensor histidine kinase VanS